MQRVDDLGLQWVIERYDVAGVVGYVGRAYVCGHANVIDTELGMAEASELPEDGCVGYFEADEVFEGFTGLRVPADLSAEFDEGELYLTASGSDLDALATTLALYGTVSTNLGDAQ